MTADQNPGVPARQRIPDHDRLNYIDRIFGTWFPLAIEPAIYSFMERLADEYNGGYWIFYRLANGGFYMAPNILGDTELVSENTASRRMSWDAAGITACLYAFSHLSFTFMEKNPVLAERCAEQFHWLREYALTHAEASAILAIID